MRTTAVAVVVMVGGRCRHDFEQIVLTIRAALTEVGRPLLAFTLTLRRY
ncbi:hypothetical protein ABZ915_47940 [Streptomyces sp. NPDC046915]